MILPLDMAGQKSDCLQEDTVQKSGCSGLNTLSISRYLWV